MKLSIPNKQGFIDNFLKPIGRLSETAILNIEGSKITSIVSSQDNTTILYSQYLLDGDVESATLNIPNIDKFINAVKIVDSDSIEFEISSNNIQYKSKSLKFKFHLYEDGILSGPKINIDKINAFKFDVNFEIDSNTFNNLIKSSLIVPTITKVYIHSEENLIFAEVTDKTTSNSDMFTVCLVDDYQGPPINKPLPLMLAPIRSISSLNLNTSIGISNEFEIAQFKVCTNQSILQYIITSVVS